MRRGKVETPIWDEYKAIVRKWDERGDDCVGMIERFDFYEAANNAYATIATGEKALYGCLILQKGLQIIFYWEKCASIFPFV